MTSHQQESIFNNQPAVTSRSTTSRLVRAAVAAAITTLLVVSCSAPAEPEKVDVPAKCYEVRNTFCTRGQTCDEQSGVPSPEFFDTCRAMFNDKTNCSSFTEILGDIEVCLNDINATPCTTFDGEKIPTPQSCEPKKLFQ